MSIKHEVIERVNSVLGRVDMQIARRSTIDELHAMQARFQEVIDRFELKEELLFEPSYNNGAGLPEGAADYLRFDHPRLQELRHRYASFSHPVIDPSLWSDQYVNRETNLQFFRGDNAYVWQHRAINTELHYLATVYYIKTIDRLGLLESLEEDSLFGAYTVALSEGLVVSRDLLDSIIEIYFLEQVLRISSLPAISILDIGAGYGRLPYRMVSSMPNIERVFCADAVAESTFISEYYLRFRGVDDRAIVVPLYELEHTLAHQRIDIAVNVHSFSECTLASIAGWLDILKKYKVRYLMIVPNTGNHGGTRLLSRERDGSSLDFSRALATRGYRLLATRPKYLDPIVQKHGVSPTYHYLFELMSP